MYFVSLSYSIKMRFIQLWLTMTSISRKKKVFCLKRGGHDLKDGLVHTVWQLWRWVVCHVLGHSFLCLGHQIHLGRTAHAAALAWSHHCNPAGRENSMPSIEHYTSLTILKIFIVIICYCMYYINSVSDFVWVFNCEGLQLKNSKNFLFWNVFTDVPQH